MTYLEVNNAVKKFGDFVAVNDISFQANEGDFITLLGPSGCGKTTLLKLLGGFHELDSGSIKMKGETISTFPPEHRDSAMCFQSYALFPHLSVQKNVAFGLEQQKLMKTEIEARVAEALRQVSLESQNYKLPNELSGGQQQRVSLARAMVMQPGMILFDEPLSNLDAKLREHVRFEIRKLQKEMNFTAIYVTHDQAEALALSDRILVLRNGKIEQSGSPREIYNQPKNRFVADFIGTANLLKGNIVKQEGEKYYVNTELGELTVISKKEPISKSIYLGWRPENARLQSDHLENKVTASVKQSAFLGSSVHVLAEKNGHTFNIEAGQSFNATNNEMFHFSIDPEGLFFLEAIHE